MAPLTVDDLLPLEEYAARRREFFDAHRRYIDRCRRVRIGPQLTLVFENRRTLWFRVQEVIRIARLSSASDIRQELNLYNRLLPGRDLLQAALLIEIPDETRFAQEWTAWQDLSGDQLWLEVGDEQFPSHLVTCRPEDRCVGTAHWVQFQIHSNRRSLLTEVSLAARFEFDNGIYKHKSALLSDDLRLSLVDDLSLCEVEEAAKELPLAA
ncbi:MAG: DUF3501 family protein [Gemmataceae bacterium]|nr:DUF3501 family protein [Gemmataceae bacterium]MCI0739740.1 DUF3501 family protein [Gemmataceae bacterium]